MFYYVHSLMTATKALLSLYKIQSSESETQQSSQLQTHTLVENIAVDNLIYLCQGVLKMREVGLWNND